MPGEVKLLAIRQRRDRPNIGAEYQVLAQQDFAEMDWAAPKSGFRPADTQRGAFGRLFVFLPSF